MANVALRVVGTVVGFWAGGPTGAAWGYQLGSLAGNIVDPAEGPTQYGARLEDLTTQSSSYGQMIPEVFGTAKLAGNVIYSSGLVERRQEDEQDSGGSCGGSSSTVVTYTYSATFAIAVCAGEIDDIIRIWADSEVILDSRTEAYKLSVNPDAEISNVALKEGVVFSIYYGTEDQLPDADLEADLGVGNVPAHRGIAYIVFRDFQLADYGNRIPNFSFEVVRDSPDTDPYTTDIDDVELLTTFVKTKTGEMVGFRASFDYYFYKIGMFSESVIQSDDVVYKTYIGPYDIDERGFMYSNRWDGTNYLPLVKFDTVALKIAKESGWTTFIPTGVTVSKNPLYPVAAITSWVATGTHDRLLVTHRDNFESFLAPWLDGYDAVSKPHATLAQMPRNAEIDNSNGLVYSVWAGTYESSDSGVYLSKYNPWSGRAEAVDISGYLKNCSFIYFHAPTNQIIIGADDNFPENEAISFFDADDFSFIAAISHDDIDSEGYLDQFRANSNERYTWITDSVSIKIIKVDLISHTVNKTYTFASPGLGRGMLYNEITNSMVVAGGSKIVHFDRRGEGAEQSLSTVVASICDKVGLESGDIDVTDLTDDVRGFLINGRGTARSSIETLRRAYLFDAVESDSKIKFVSRAGKTSALTISKDDLGAKQPGSEFVDPITIVREQELALPQQVDIVYFDYATDYGTGNQLAQIFNTNSVNKTSVSLPIAFSADEAAQLAEKQLKSSWTERLTLDQIASSEYAYLEPTDLITIDNGDSTHLIRLNNVKYGSISMSLSGATVDISSYSSTANGSTGPYTGNVVAYYGSPVFYALDVPALKFNHNFAGVYFVAESSAGWRGVSIFRSADEGVSWSAFNSMENECTVGSVADAAADFAGGNVFDHDTTIDVRLLDDTKSLSTVTEIEVLNGANPCAVGDEVLQFATATDNGDGTFTISDLLRGRRGTEWAISEHSAGEYFVFLNENTMGFSEVPVADLNSAIIYKAVPFGLSFDSGTNSTFTSFSVATLKPYSPADFEGAVDGSSNIDLTWKRRTRLNGEWLDLVDVPMNETSESYEVDVIEVSTSGVVRTIDATSELAEYTLTQQQVDFGSPTAVKFIVYQLSESVGRGFASDELTGFNAG